VARMRLSRAHLGLALLGLVLACATPRSSVREEGEPPQGVASWEEARADPTCVVPRCDERGCALWRCQDLVAVDGPAVVRTRGTLTLPLTTSSPMRWWGRPLDTPFDSEPVFEIPWHNWNIRGRYAARALRLPCIPAREPFEKHHIFPQEPQLASWFKKQGIDIHAFTVRVPKSFHVWLHSGGPKGGQWNEAWRQFQEDTPRATEEQMWRFAFELMDRFGVNGPLVAYYCQEG
jgi:uncharacterized lipoprotein (TIGR02269 family)